MSQNIWRELELYYHMNGSAILCCCPVHQYSQEIYYYQDDIHELDAITRSIIEYTYNLVKMEGFTPDLYESTIVCSSVSLYPFLSEKKVLCVYILDKHSTLISNDPMVFVNSDDLESPCVWVYLWC